jgi:tol-pal system protein YbgF
MMCNRSVIFWLIVFVALSCERSVQAEPGEAQQDEAGYGTLTLENRVSKLEKRLSGQQWSDFATDLDKLQSDVKKLRGALEEQRYEFDKAQKLDQEKIQALEKKNAELEDRLKGGMAGPAATGSLPPSPSPESPAASPAGGSPPVPSTPQPPAPVAAATTAPQDPLARKGAYQKAFDTLKQGKYNDAIVEFKNFVLSYPKGDLSDNAYYWLGEAYYVNRDFTAAKDAFRKVISEFPQSNKIPDANLKIAFIEYENAQFASAKGLLEDIVKRFPDTSAAKMAEKRLERMRSENR